MQGCTGETVEGSPNTWLCCIFSAGIHVTGPCLGPCLGPGLGPGLGPSLGPGLRDRPGCRQAAGLPGPLLSRLQLHKGAQCGAAVCRGSTRPEQAVRRSVRIPDIQQRLVRLVATHPSRQTCSAVVVQPAEQSRAQRCCIAQSAELLQSTPGQSSQRLRQAGGPPANYQLTSLHFEIDKGT